MEADAIRALANRKYPAERFATVARAFTSLAADTALSKQVLAEKGTTVHKAVDHALTCIATNRAEGTRVDAKAIAHSVEDHFPCLSENDCSDVAQAALAVAGVAGNESDTCDAQQPTVKRTHLRRALKILGILAVTLCAVVLKLRHDYPMPISPPASISNSCLRSMT